MRCVLVLFLSVFSLGMSAVPLSTVEGRVTSGDDPLPGCTVRLESSSLLRTAVSDVEGRYRFVGVATGEYEIHFELEGFEPARERGLVREEVVTIPVQELRISAITEEIVMMCGWPCSDDPPSDRFARPRCSEYELHSALIESARQGDASSVELLRSRYATADTYSERHRLGGALLRKTRDDAEIWNELVSHAEIALRFPHVDGLESPEFLQHCTELSVDPDSHWWMGQDALDVASDDPRSHALLLRALATDDETLVYLAIVGLAGQRDFDSLPLIESAIRRFDDRNDYYTDFLADQLALFQSEHADAVAMKFLESEDDLARYGEMRAAAAALD
ncbi:MAG: carboxypeptidase-like regulatory domain-containing protein [Acidobacteriota bacterium]|nr:carboxypeptidase-like regulatory domain-containing protein [Acidobacteriota bacterium]